MRFQKSRGFVSTVRPSLPLLLVSCCNFLSLEYTGICQLTHASGQHHAASRHSISRCGCWKAVAAASLRLHAVARRIRCTVPTPKHCRLFVAPHAHQGRQAMMRCNCCRPPPSPPTGAPYPPSSLLSLTSASRIPRLLVNRFESVSTLCAAAHGALTAIGVGHPLLGALHSYACASHLPSRNQLQTALSQPQPCWYTRPSLSAHLSCA